MDIKNINIYHEVHGENIKGSVVFINGLGSQLINWSNELLNPIINSGYQAILIDNRDVGLSDSIDEKYKVNKDFYTIYTNNEHINPPYTLDDMANDVANLIKKLYLKNINVIGSSMGGMIAQKLAINYPSILESLVIISSTISDRSLPGPSKEVLKILSSSSSHETLEDYLRYKLEVYKVYNPSSKVDNKILKDKYKKAFLRSYNPDGANRQMLALLAETSRENKLRKLDLPVLLIHGKDDPVFSIDHAIHLKNCINGSTLIALDGVGHSMPEDIFSQISWDIISFLDKARSKNLANNC